MIPSQAIQLHRKSVSIEFPLDSGWYCDLTKPQRLVFMFAFLMAGNTVNPKAYADRVGTTRGAVYQQMRRLSQMGVPIVREGYGRWKLMQFIPKESPYRGL